MFGLNVKLSDNPCNAVNMKAWSKGMPVVSIYFVLSGRLGRTSATRKDGRNDVDVSSCAMRCARGALHTHDCPPGDSLNQNGSGEKR